METSSSRAIFFSNLLKILEDWGLVPGPFPFRNLAELLNNRNYFKIPVLHSFEKVNKRHLKMVSVNY